MSNPQLLFGSDEPIPLGIRAEFHGVDVVAIDLTVGCSSCAFYYRGKGPNHCIGTPCNGVVWLTVPDYITRRLTS